MSFVPATLFALLTRVCAGIGAALFVAAGAMLTYEVVARYFFTAPTIWAAELSQLCLIWGTLLSMAYVLAHGRHIAVDAVAGRLPYAVRRVTETLALGVVAVFSGFVVWYGSKIFWDSFERGRTTGSMLDLPSWLAELPVPVGFAVLGIQAVLSMRNAWAGRFLTAGHGEGEA
ncbi:MAG: TRAP transporter small permease [Pseudomonadota bacterium]